VDDDDDGDDDGPDTKATNVIVERHQHYQVPLIKSAIIDVTLFL